MNKKLGRLLRPNMGWYITVMLLFAVAAAVFGDYWLAGLELLVTAGVFVLYMSNRSRRKKRLQEFPRQPRPEHSLNTQVLYPGF